MLKSILLFYLVSLVKTCTKAVDDMKEDVKKLKDDERVNGFGINQLCIAEKSCAKKHKLNNPSWLDNVLNAFVEPYIERHGEWYQVIDECHNLDDPWYKVDPKYRCQELMADYHIANDLQNALDTHGCGTKEDWDAIYKDIKACISETDMNGLYSLIAKWEVQSNRDSVREKCIEYRKLHGLQVEF